MAGRILGLFGLVVAFVLTAQLRGSYLLNPDLRTTATMAAFLVGVAFLAAVVSGGILGKRRKYWRPPASETNRRQTFRIVYPQGEQPRLTVERPQGGSSGVYQVIDLSEEGLRLADNASLAEGAEVKGELVFADDRTAQVAGTVVRRVDRHVCLHLTHTIPANLIVDEQLRLRKRERIEDH